MFPRSLWLNVEVRHLFLFVKLNTHFMFIRSAPASPSHGLASGMITPDVLSREGSPVPEQLVDVSQSAPVSPGHSGSAYPGSGNMIGHQQMSALVGATKARLLIPNRDMDQHSRLLASPNGQDHQDGRLSTF